MLRPAPALILASAVALAGCEPVRDNPRTAGGAAIGAGSGALLGTLAGGNDRRNALIGAGIGLIAGAAVGQYLDRQQAQLEQDLAGSGADVYRDGDELRVRLPSNVTFATDSAEIQPRFRDDLANVADTLREYPSSYIDVIGHTDDTGAASYNQQLSERRAASVGYALQDRGVRPARIATMGRGERDPVASNETPEGRQANRRVELRIVPVTEQG